MTRTNWVLVFCLLFLGAAWLYADSEKIESVEPPRAVVPQEREGVKAPPPPAVARPAQGPLAPPGPMGGGPMGIPPMGSGPGTPGGPGDGLNHKDLVPSLIAALDDKDGDVRQSVAAALATIGAPAVKPLLEVLKDAKKDAGLRANAAYVLGQIGPAARDALPDLLKALKGDFPETDVQIRKRAAYAVSQMVGSSYYGPMGYQGMPEAQGTRMKAADPGLVVPAKVIEKN